MPQDVTGTPPSQAPLAGAVPGISVSGLIRRLADILGYQVTSSRFRAAAITWIQDSLQEIQLLDPKLQRTYVMDAPITLSVGIADYDVRQAPFSWTNCYAVNTIKVPSLQNLVLERVNPEQYRYRGVLAADSGPPSYFVQLDQFRVRIVPTPDVAYVAVGDYQQDIPQISNDNDRVDWPRAWDIVLLEGCKWRGFQWRSEQDPTWQVQRRLFERMLDAMKTGENLTSREPGKAVVVRARRGSVIPHDNSADIRRRY